MRRQARISGGGTLGVRSASALQVWLWLLIFIFQNEFRISRSIQPGYLDFDNLPETNFTCAGKVIGGYYADLETSCQMFHVCTVGQQEEPMDIKFLCLNGTVFDQETRVCERVDEVDCTKSEKFYSLNLELYGSTAPPLIQSDQTKPQTQSTEHSKQQTKPSQEEESDPTIDETSTTLHNKIRDQHFEAIDSTEDPMQDIRKDDRKQAPTPPPTHQLLPAIDDEETEYEDEDVEYEEDYQHSPTTTTTAPTTTKTTTTSTTTTKAPPITTPPPQSSSHHYSAVHHVVSSPSPTVSSLPSPTSSSSALPASPVSSLDSALLTPQEFIHRHRGAGSEAISFQRQSFRPADGVFITHAPPQQLPQQYDHYPYESSRTAPRPAVARPAPFVLKPLPAPFRPTTLDPRDQLLRPGPTSQPSERHETSIKHRPQQYPPILPPQRPLPFNPYYYDRKRSDDSRQSENESSLSARSVAPPAVTERPPAKPKSPPRVIVTASASVSDSNGKRLNYTVGNVVSAVKPIVPINYDDYKESDLIFDPFFLDVPKLQKRRKSRSSRRNRKIITIPATATVFPNLKTAKERNVTTSSPIASQATKGVSRLSSTESTSTTTAAWNPDDYVDDNYEPHAYQAHAPPPPAVVVAYDHKFKKHESSELKSNVASVGRMKQPTPTSSAAQTTSSQMEDAVVAPSSSLPLPPPPFETHSCATLRSHDCRTRA